MNYVIKGINLTILKGEKILLKGPSGSGKSTIVKCITNIIDNYEGSIKLNDVNIKDISVSSLRKIIVYVGQEETLFRNSIKDNIIIDNYDKEKLNSAFEKAGITDKINALPDKEKSFMIKDVHKNAVDFSGGEKQKLLLAKAIYKNAPVLILDEPTAALDPISENELYLKYNEMTDNKISFFISHRLSSTRFCDKILFIKNGTIAESGTHEELMALKGAYYRMYQIQSYYYQETGGDAV